MASNPNKKVGSPLVDPQHTNSPSATASPVRASPVTSPASQQPAVKPSVMASISKNSLADSARIKALQAKWEEARKRSEMSRQSEVKQSTGANGQTPSTTNSQAEAKSQTESESGLHRVGRSSDDLEYNESDDGDDGSESGSGSEKDEGVSDILENGPPEPQPLRPSATGPSNHPTWSAADLERQRKIYQAAGELQPSKARSHKRSFAEINRDSSSSAEPPSKMSQPRVELESIVVCTSSTQATDANGEKVSLGQSDQTPPKQVVERQQSGDDAHGDVKPVRSTTLGLAYIATYKGSVVNADGKSMPVLTMTENRSYNELIDVDGRLTSARGALIPTGYKLVNSDIAPYICPVRDCQKQISNIKTLGGHFRSCHCKVTFNDNGDGTLSRIGPYTHDTWKSLPGVIVSKNPLPLNSSPPVPLQPAPLPPPPAPSPASAPRPLPSAASPSRPTPIAATATTAASTDPGRGDALRYLHSFLSSSQSTIFREDVKYMALLPIRRELPEAWLAYHGGRVLEPQLYSCSLAYIVGEEVSSPSERCHHIDVAVTGTAKNSLRLSRPCIRPPPEMPPPAKLQFSKVATCVGCRYWAQLLRKSNPCDWAHPAPGARYPSSPSTGTSRAVVSPKVVAAPRVEDRNPGGGTSSSPSGGVALESARAGHDAAAVVTAAAAATADASAAVSSSPVPRLRTSVQKSADVSMADAPSSRPENKNDGMTVMEDWEFAPGKVMDSKGRQTIAFSTSYLTGTQPISIADDVSINRVHMPPGAMHRWPADRGRLRYCEVISGKVELRMDGKSFSMGQGGVFVIRPSLACTVENRRYVEAILSCHAIENYSLVEGGDE
ncbi:putative serine esterase (DUF676) [Geosmithia morbida]|uniref:Serine esterase (DUF676) n=1 Tax=Geosmithia morbida TaxID=1094350 RepID=A0A9P4YS10_9HYPO|nr:putative serine esterase (DUF676) [Geosmithia morbida]KAF4120658.1 putative serine esterase (DUF676) [Geosmithia morbida]